MDLDRVERLAAFTGAMQKDQQRPGFTAPQIARRQMQPQPLRAGLAGYLHGQRMLAAAQIGFGIGTTAAAPGDTVVIAGRGHEPRQIIGSERRVFDDRVVAREILAGMGYSMNGSGR